MSKHMASPCINNSTNSKTLNPEPNVDQTLVKVSPQSSRVIFNLGSYSEPELKEFKDKFVSDLEKIRSLVKQIEAHEFELVRVEDVDLRKRGDSADDKSGKITGTMPMTLTPADRKSKQIEAREFELVQAEDVGLRKEGDCGDKSGKITGQKRAMPMSPADRESKRKRLERTMEMDSVETRRVEAVMMRKCGVILEKLMKHRNGWVFNEPVDVVALGLSDYHEVVKRPMDLGTVKSKLGKRVYRNPLGFARDVRLTFDNALLYNRKGDDVHTMATGLLDMFDKLFDPAYEKFEVERHRVIVQQQKFGKSQSQVVSSQRDAEKPLQMHPQAALPKKICKEAATKAASKQKRTMRVAEENPRMRREMSVQEKDKLERILEDFAGEYLDDIVQIVAKRNPKMTTPDGEGDIELDVCALDNETMWDLHRFFKLKLKAEQNNKVSL